MMDHGRELRRDPDCGVAPGLGRGCQAGHHQAEAAPGLTRRDGGVRVALTAQGEFHARHFRVPVTVTMSAANGIERSRFAGRRTQDLERR